ncbi:MAG: CoA-binding protein [Dehalococcoidia bacterium]|nr:CoA-binding protein [Dehalococcoidia bacterium]
MPKHKRDSLDIVFHPRSIAVVGASADDKKSGSKWVSGLVRAGYKGNIYPVSRHGGRIAGLEISPSLSAIPGEVDYVIASVPAQSALSLVEECIKKGARVIQFFTAGFSETGEADGRHLEQRMLERARTTELRIIGPNCIGSYCPETNIPLGPVPDGKVGKAGDVAFISQSGGIGAKLVQYGIARQLNFSKGISLGNSIDFDAADFFEYFASDSGTNTIAAYLEGTRDGHKLFRAIRLAAAVKPTVVWKGGRTEAGAIAARSHTGSLASSAPVWSAMLRQAGAIEARNLEEMTDCLLLLQKLGSKPMRRVAVIGGLADGGGGISVSGSDACNDNGLLVPELSPVTRSHLKKLIGEVGSILINPVDVSPAQFRGMDTLYEAIRTVARDPGIEVLIIQEDMDIMLSFLGQPETDEISQFLATVSADTGIPLVMVMPPGANESERVVAEQQLLSAGVPVIPTMARAARALAMIAHRPTPTRSSSALQ